jgi:hypothetical protein
MVGSVFCKSWFEIFSQGRSKVADDARLGAEVAEPTVTRILCCRFQCTSKKMGQVYQCWQWICQEINVFFHVQISHVLHFISICGLFTNPPSYEQGRKEYSLQFKNVDDQGTN